MSKLGYFILIVIIGTLLGAFIGKAISKVFPHDSTVKEMLAVEITPGLRPTTVDLGIVELTFVKISSASFSFFGLPIISLPKTTIVSAEIIIESGNFLTTDCAFFNAK